jgi:hypothetical protein
MKALSISITSHDWSALRRSLLTDDGNENAAVLLCGVAETSQERRLLVRRFREVTPDQYLERLPYHLKVSPLYYNAVIDECLANRLTPVIVHSHPSSEKAWYSKSDDYGESRLLPVLESLLPGTTPASLVITPGGATGRRFARGHFAPINCLKITGVPSRTICFDDPDEIDDSKVSPQFDRQTLGFGVQGQRILERLKVAIVGVGGTGSLVAEQLARAGVADAILVDPDRIEVSNVSRLFGATLQHIGALKVEVVGQNVRKLGASKVKFLADSALRQDVLMNLRNRDVILGCVDNDRTRAILNRFAHQYLIPFIDLGIRLDGRGGTIKAAAGRVTVAGSGMTCLRCSHHLNPERIRAESLPLAERRRLEREGYVMGIDAPAPAVVSLNAVIAGLGTTATLNLFVGLTGALQPLDQLYDATSGTVFTSNPTHEKGCDICDEKEGVKALGDAQIVSAYN